MKKLKMIALSVLSMLSIASCAGKKEETPAVTLTGSFTSPANLTYVNNRPTFNYFMTTFDFEVLDTYSDNSYVLTVSSSCFSALELPEEGNAAKGNERVNYLSKYYGTFTKTVDDLDEDMVYFSLSEPTRVVSNYDSIYYADSANWTDAMSASVYDSVYVGTGGQTEKKYYTSGEEYLAAKKYAAVKVKGSIKNASIDYAALTIGSSANA